MTSGLDVKEQAMAALSNTLLYAETYEEAHAALAPCVVLAPEEVAKVRDIIRCAEHSDALVTAGEYAEALALLTPQKRRHRDRP
jgi:hypothetical protein